VAVVAQDMEIQEAQTDHNQIQFQILVDQVAEVQEEVVADQEQ
jgi:hypothetical protein